VLTAAGVGALAGLVRPGSRANVHRPITHSADAGP